VPSTRESILRYFRLLLRTFFRPIEITGRGNVPTDRGCLALSWHPNGIIDGAVLLSYFPRPIVVGARHGLFQWPLLGWLLQQLGAVPIYRRRDAGAGTSTADRQTANRQAIDALAQAIAKGSCSALFPEGTSHDDPHLLQLKAGAAHLFYRAVELTPEGAPLPVIIPVGLHYSHKTLFGSQLLVAFHPPLALPADLAKPAANEETRRAQANRLTREFDRVLSEVVMATESWEVHHLMHRARKLIRAEGFARAGTRSQAPGVVDRVRHFASIWKRYEAAMARYPKETKQLLARVARYDRLLGALRLEGFQLDSAAWVASPHRAIWLALEFLFVYLVLPPFLLIGVLVNLVPAFIVWGFSRLVARHYKDEATLKILVGAFVFPLTWLLVAWLVGWGEGLLADSYPRISLSPILTGVVAFVLSALGGLLALQYRQIATRTWRTLRLQLTRARRKEAIRSLLEIRSRIFDEFLELDRKLMAPPAEEP
jgi:glycerol-3-phosphate O-acyltransferase/dihydroxyacetone phosphate acyltransferase